MQMTHRLSHPDSTLQTFLPPNPNFSSTASLPAKHYFWGFTCTLKPKDTLISALDCLNPWLYIRILWELQETQKANSVLN